MQACKAYYQRGRFIPLEPISIPDGSQAIVTIIEESTDEICPRQREALARFREEIRNCNEPVPEFKKVQFREIDV